MLAGDVGGTKTNLALCDDAGARGDVHGQRLRLA
jgi:hypothetical protein